MDSQKQSMVLDTLYPSRMDSWPTYKSLIERYLKKGDMVLDAGCGRLSGLGHYTSETELAVGVDHDLNSVKENNIPNRIVCRLEHMPLRDKTFDLITSVWVIEHLKNPMEVLSELSRVIRKDGVLIIVTVNVKSIFGFISMITPLSLHKVLRTRFLGLDEPTKTYYKCNTLSRIDNTLSDVGFKRAEVLYADGLYCYFTFSKILFSIAVLVERILDNRFLRRFKQTLLCAYRKT